MNKNQPIHSRRGMMLSAGMVIASANIARLTGAAPSTADAAEPFGYCLNTSTISGQNLGIAAELDLAAKVGFSAVEPWIRELDAFQKSGGSLADLRKRIDDLGL